MRAFVCISALCVLACATGCQSTSGYVMNASGQTYYDQGNYAMAAQEFQRAIAANPLNADYIANLAASMKQQGNVQGAELAWRQALHVNPSHQPSYHGLAQLLVENNRQDDAAALLSTWAASQPYSAEPQIELAWFSREMGDANAASQYLQQALRVSPNNARAQAALGQFYQDTGRTAEAITMYQQSLRSDWYQPEVQSRLSTLKGYAAPRVARAMRMGRRAKLPRGGTLNTASFRNAGGLGQPAMGGLPANQAGIHMGMNSVLPHAQPGMGMPMNASSMLPGGPMEATTDYPLTNVDMQPYQMQPYQGPTFGNVSSTSSAPIPQVDQTFTPGVPGTPQVTEYPPPIPPVAGGEPSLFAEPPGQNADPAHVPQMSATPEVQPF